MRYNVGQEVIINGSRGAITYKLQTVNWLGGPEDLYTISFYDKDLIPPELQLTDEQLSRHTVLPGLPSSGCDCGGKHISVNHHYDWCTTKREGK